MRQAALAVGEDRLHSVVSRAATSPNPAARLSLATLCSHAADARLAASAVSLLLDRDPGVAGMAERAIVTLAVLAMLEDSNTGVADALAAAAESHGLPPDFERGLQNGVLGDTDLILSEVAEAVMTFSEHRRRGAVLASLLLLSAPLTRPHAAHTQRPLSPGAGALASWFGQVPDTSHSAMKGLLRSSELPITRVRALEWLNRPDYGPAAAERLSRASLIAEHELVLSRAHLLVNPRRARAALKVKVLIEPATVDTARTAVFAAGSALPGFGTVARLSIGARRGLARFAAGISLSPGVRRATAQTLLTDADPVTRHAAVRHTTPGGMEDFCFDSDERVARSAMLMWSSAGESRRAPGAPASDPAVRRTLELLSRSPHRAVRTWASADLRNQAEVFSDTLAGRSAARRWLIRDRGGFVEHLRQRIGSSGDASGVIVLIRRLRLAPDFQSDLTGLLRDGRGKPRLIATAVAAAGDLTGEEVLRELGAFLNHGDARVRANAVEAVTRHARLAVPIGATPMLPYAGRIIELKSDDHHRVRANAIRAAMLAVVAGAGGEPEFSAADLMASMLTDQRQMHRLAGVWLASRTLVGNGRKAVGPRWSELVARVGEVAKFDDAHGVRIRAASCASRVDAEVRCAWRSAGAGVGAGPC